MSTDKNKLSKGLKFVFGAIPFFFLAPILINIGFSAIKKDQNYVFIGIGIIAAVSGIALVFVGLKTLLAALFQKD